ncbi:MAG: hypothetical protein ACRC7O_05445 [Fimbriiglobus sp.]
MPRLGLLALVAAVGLPPALFAQPVTRADLAPGLVFAATDAGGATITRLEPTVALTLSAGEAAHPRSSGGETFTWDGYINVLIPGKYKFDATLLGKLTVKVGEKVVFAGTETGADPKAAKLVAGADVDLTPGIQPFRAELTRTGPAVRAELIWKGPLFRGEPVPYFFFGHLPKQRPAGFAADAAREHGRFLFEELACGKCHGSDAANDSMAKTLTERAGPNLTEIGKRAFPGWLDVWLADPQKMRQHTAMPKMFADTPAGTAERFAVVSYLTSLGGPLPDTKPNGNPGELANSVKTGGKLYLTVGCAACHGDNVNADKSVKKPKDDEDDEKPALKPEDSFYAAGTTGPGGYYRLGAVGAKFTAESLQKFLQDPLATNPHGRMPNMVLTGDEARDIARFLVATTGPALAEFPKTPDTDPVELAAALFPAIAVKRIGTLNPEEQWKAVGKALVSAKGCVNCHTVAPGGKPLPSSAAPGRTVLTKAAPAAGCLAARPDPAKVPAFTLTAGQRAALAGFLADGLYGPGTTAPGYQARLAVKRFNCLNCHNRDGEGGLDEALADKMKSLENAQNADDVQPPRLTGVGHKLRTSWFQQVLTGAGRARPWMSLRMPQYGEGNVAFLADALPQLEGTVPDDAVKKADTDAAKVNAGRTLTGKAGLGCIACHDISGVQGGGTRGPDLAVVPQRVRRDWYDRWMHQPQRLVPGTKMPQNFIDGKSQLTTVLGGDGDAQVEAIWAYLSLGPGLPLPSGIEPPGQALVVVVKDRPEILRTFMPDAAGTKAIAVGYPGGTNLVFDAATCRLGYAWNGNFLDAAPVWNNRGGAPAKLLGTKFWTAPVGHPWAVTNGKTPPDFAKRSADPAFGFQLPNDEVYAGPRYVNFAGFSLDAAGNPTFRYLLDGPDGKQAAAVVEKPEPLPVTVAAGLSRTFTLDVKPGQTVWFHAADAGMEPKMFGPDGARKDVDLKERTAEVPAVGTRVLAPQPDGKATVLEVTAAPAGTTWHLVKQGAGWSVLLRLPEAAAGGTQLTVNVWGLAKDDDSLLKGLKK